MDRECLGKWSQSKLPGLSGRLSVQKQLKKGYGKGYVLKKGYGKANLLTQNSEK